MSAVEKHDAGVVGAGPAGIAAAMQLARYGVTPVVFEKASPGGLLRTAWRVENFPGFPSSIAGPDLAALLGRQLGASGAELVCDEVESLAVEDGLLVCRAGGRALGFRSVIVASGTRPRDVAVPAISSEASRSVFREAGELWDVEDSSIAIMGGGDAAFDYALGLAQRNDVTIFVRGSAPCCLPVLEARARASERVNVRERVRITEVDRNDDGRLELAVLSELADGVCQNVGADYLVLAVGREPEDAFISEEILKRAPALATGAQLLFAGDVRSGIFRQASIAAGQGVHAAMTVAAMLQQRRVNAGSR